MEILLALYYTIACALSTSLASAMHGGNYAGKGYIVAIHCLLFPLSAPLFWIFFRRKAQAQAELNLLDGATADEYEAVEDAYHLPAIGQIMVRVMRRWMKNSWPEFGNTPIRRQQEICGGFVLGALCSLPFLLCLISL